ncbi:hypothetical protein VFPFJ_00826 [Purpureocillium lilacinum]|uniref:Uncharacterized protein n=1 Tax=Purpureocillium lilacinum TaxID=33203 RepID=A0A179HWF7_PURLI|nr:hypothetical protein VFPFJ_00826 [Purpureocillium lilacinum]OAQ86751.1 hypothetical protein VFPBJ_00791 [Purpureocillium lilacinum]OAQ94717.1 hypothetical protein VFPFJ_00826 [Purpureocillium lilacinum]
MPGKTDNRACHHQRFLRRRRRSTMPGHRRRRHVYLDARSWRSLPVTLFVSSVLSPYLAPSPSDASQSNHEPDCQGCLIVGMPQNSGCTLRPDTALRPDGRFA